MTKTVKEFLLDSSTGEVDVEYSDNTTTSFNLANAITATQSAQGLAKLSLGTDDATARAAVSPIGRIVGGVEAALMGGCCAVLQTQGDSTGDEGWEWVHRIAEKIGARNPGACVIYRVWDDATQEFIAPVVLQNGDAGQRYLVGVSGASGTRSYYMPASAIPAFTGDLDVSVDIDLSAWSAGVAQALIGQYGTTAGKKGWKLEITSTNRLAFTWTADGSTDVATVFPGTSPAYASGRKKIRVTLDVDNGAGSHVVTLYDSDDDITWNVLHTVTRAGTTSVYASNAYDYEVMGRQTYGAPTGKFYGAKIRQGIGGALINPQSAEDWICRIANSGYQSGSYGGSPTLYVWNGSKPGSDNAYLTDTTRFPKMVPPHVGATIILSAGHNDTNLQGLAYQTALDSWLAQLKSRCPLSSINVVTQNPKIYPRVEQSVVLQQARRRAEKIEWARRNGVGVADTYLAIVNDPRGAAALVDSGGVHPVADGEEVWANCVMSS